MKERDSLYPYADGSKFRGKTNAEVFRDIYTQASWNLTHRDSVSGEGSNVEQTAQLRRALPPLLKHLGVRTLLDIPCGDYYWMQRVDLQDIHYIGADIVPELIASNQQKYNGAYRTFLIKDLLRDALPEADLIFCRDCLVHLSLADISAALENIRQSKAQWLLTTHFTEETINKDIDTGGWRPLNFCLPPFSFPAPEALINEQCSEMDGAFQDKSMALWKVSKI